MHKAFILLQTFSFLVCPSIIKPICSMVHQEFNRNFLQSGWEWAGTTRQKHLRNQDTPPQNNRPWYLPNSVPNLAMFLVLGSILDTKWLYPRFCLYTHKKRKPFITILSVLALNSQILWGFMFFFHSTRPFVWQYCREIFWHSIWHVASNLLYYTVLPHKYVLAIFRAYSIWFYLAYFLVLFVASDRAFWFLLLHNEFWHCFWHSPSLSLSRRNFLFSYNYLF